MSKFLNKFHLIIHNIVYKIIVALRRAYLIVASRHIV